jgi:hypothetical protein
VSESYVQIVLREFKRLKKLAEDAVVQLSDEQFFAHPSPGDNSAAVIMKHVAGNLVSRWTDFLTSDGEKPERNRDTEFAIAATDTREHLLQQWERGWMLLFAAIAPLTESDLQRPVTIRSEQLTVLQAINRQLTHYAYHVGQIVYVSKHRSGAAWRTLSIPLGSSEDFNRRPKRYVSNA